MRFSEKILDFLFPKFCLACKKEGTYLCSECFSKLETLPAPFCPYCNSRSFDGRICKRCRKFLFGFIAVGLYGNELLRKLIDTFKYNFVKELANPLAFLIFKFLKENPEIEFFKNPLDFKILPIPLYPRRLRWRGFNQAEKIALELSSLLKIPVENNVLLKIKSTKPQVGLKREERRENIKGVFKVLKQGEIKNKKIILLDDVATTLSTLEEAAKALREAGIKKIWGLVVAKG